MFADRIVEIKIDDIMHRMVKFIYSEKATKFCEISTLLLSYVVPVNSKVKILQNFLAFSEYMNFKEIYKRYLLQHGPWRIELTEKVLLGDHEVL